MGTIRHTHTAITSQSETAREKRDFEVKDDKGRSVGAIALCHTVTLERVTIDINEDDRDDYSQESPGTYYDFRPQELRDGKYFGNPLPVQKFKTKEERDKAVKAFFVAQKKKAKPRKK